MSVTGSEPGSKSCSKMIVQKGMLAFAMLAAVTMAQHEAKAERTGEQVVQAQCAKCHGTGEGGAPKIGDRAAWTPRLQQGLNAAVASAISGHGGMPARGGLANLTDAEIRSAAVLPANRKTVGKVEVYLGVVSTESLSAQSRKGGPGGAMHGGVPSGAGYYHVNISLIDTETKGEITDAKVEVTVEDVLNRSESKKLELIGIGNRISYGNFFEMSGKDPYSIGVRIQRPGAAAPITTKFEFKPSA
jgi:cytochrome c5